MIATTRLINASMTETYPIEPEPVPAWDTYTLLLNGLYTISFGSGPTTIVATILPVVLGGEELVPRPRGKNAVRTSIIMTVPVTDILIFVMRIPFNPIGYHATTVVVFNPVKGKIVPSTQQSGVG